VLIKLLDSTIPSPPESTARNNIKDKGKKRKTFVEQVLEKKAQPETPQQMYSLAADAPPKSNVVESLLTGAKRVVGKRRHQLMT
jgi:hypothetical protein